MGKVGGFLWIFFISVVNFGVSFLVKFSGLNFVDLLLKGIDFMHLISVVSVSSVLIIYGLF